MGIMPLTLGFVGTLNDSPSTRLHREYSIGLSSFIQLVVILHLVVMDLLRGSDESDGLCAQGKKIHDQIFIQF